MRLRFSALAVFFTALSLSLPSAVFAENAVSRGSFLRAAIRRLEIPMEDDSCTLPFKNVPKSAAALACTAYTHHALDQWSKRALDLTRPVTRGEALQILTALTDTRETADISAFSDIKSSAMKQAVMNAVAKQWMKPMRSTLFGISKTLAAEDVAVLLEAVNTVTVQSVTIPITVNTGLLPLQDLQNAVWKIIQQDYLYVDKVDSTEASYTSIEAIVSSLKDPYSVFFRKESADSFASQIKGVLEGGIGAHVEMKDNVLTIVSPIVGSPAQKAGLQPGDQILEANSTVLAGMTVDKAVSFIRGEKGTPVILKIRRDNNDLTITVIRDVITIPETNLSWQGDTAIVTLQQFGEHTDQTIRQTFKDIAAKQPRGIVLDLRNDPGGLLHAAVEVLSNFLPKGSPVVLIKSRDGTANQTTNDEPTISPDTKLVLLVNNGSASASEIVAGALKYWKRAIIIGTKTFGKGSVQEVVNFKDGEALKLTIATFGPPDGSEINGIGVLPDIEIADPAMQMRRALELAR